MQGPAKVSQQGIVKCIAGASASGLVFGKRPSLCSFVSSSKFIDTNTFPYSADIPWPVCHLMTAVISQCIQLGTSLKLVGDEFEQNLPATQAAVKQASNQCETTPKPVRNLLLCVLIKTRF